MGPTFPFGQKPLPTCQVLSYRTARGYMAAPRVSASWFLAMAAQPVVEGWKEHPLEREGNWVDLQVSGADRYALRRDGLLAMTQSIRFVVKASLRSPALPNP